ncbi:MAG: hypothetical protein COB22_05600 [Cycloclasticus sp.]|nr:MAG: hypothetical protein COB22_05600 [Cycloclasticus sp.]
MNKIEHPIQSVKSLVKAVIAATALAVIILVTAILPAEYGVAPTGLGAAMGLTVLSEPLEAPTKAKAGACSDVVSLREDTVKIVVPAHSGLEYKLFLEKSVVLDYSWRTDGGVLFFDFHGEPQGDTTGYFKSYKETSAVSDSGSKKVPFTGSHGWYWKNESQTPITVFLETKGEYQIIGLR